MPELPKLRHRELRLRLRLLKLLPRLLKQRCEQ